MGFNNVVDESDRMKDGIAGDEVFNLLQIRAGGRRPAGCAIWQFFLSALDG